MAQSVVIKSNKYGIQLIMDPEISFEELLDAVAAKFRESRKFFRDAKLAIAFEGRSITQEESLMVIDTITANSDVSIICIIDEERSKADMFRREIAIFYDSMAGKEGDFYKGDVKAGRTLESESGII
ncbi:MAG: septum site-determining protein MinC, partial [Clostridiales bacterium]|nr:septum site-determining protein MinC [Clostridiales bacterium]